MASGMYERTCRWFERCVLPRWFTPEGRPTEAAPPAIRESARESGSVVAKIERPSDVQAAIAQAAKGDGTICFEAPTRQFWDEWDRQRESECAAKGGCSYMPGNHGLCPRCGKVVPGYEYLQGGRQ